MRRREFISLVGGAAAWPLAARGQQANPMRRIGVLLASSERDAQAQANLAALIKGLEELGWRNGRNIQITYRWGEANVERMQTFAKELVGQRPDLVVGHTTPAVAALLRETTTIPIVFTSVSDPVGSGFVASLPRPGRNITGFINIESSLSGKWIEMLTDILPRVTRASLMFNPETAPYFEYYLQLFEAAARSRAIEPIAAPVRTVADLERVVASLADRPDVGLVLMADIFVAVRRNLDLIIALAARHRVPTIYPYRYMVAAGGLASYGVDLADLLRRAAGYVDRILKGANPAELPVQLPTRFELAVNLKTAKALGLEVPAMLLGRADEVIE
jgi:putative ABC transport system substrate-binding protein